MKFIRIDHIGIAVPNLEEAVKNYTTLLGKGSEHSEEVAEQQVKTAFFAIDDTNIELLQSTSPDGPIGKFIEKNGGRGGIHHICIQVKNIRSKVSSLSIKCPASGRTAKKWRSSIQNQPGAFCWS